MSIGEICTRSVVFTHDDSTVREAAELMARHHVGDLVIVERNEENEIEPTAIVTDRDLVVEVMARGRDPDRTHLRGLGPRRLVTALESEEPAAVLERMRTSGVRRVPVVGPGGELVGIITFDDLVEWLAEELATLSRVVAAGDRRERARPP